MDVPQQGQKLSAEFGYKMLFLDEEGGEQNGAVRNRARCERAAALCPVPAGKAKLPQMAQTGAAVRSQAKPEALYGFILYFFLRTL